MQISRKHFTTMAATAGSLAFVRFPGDAAEITLKYGNDNPTTHATTQAVIRAAARIHDQTKGRVVIEVYPFSQLGGSTQMLQQLRLGAIDLLSTFDTLLEGAAAVVGITGVPFIFKTAQDAWTAVDGPLRTTLQTACAGLGIYRFPRAWQTGFRQVSNNVRPIKTPEDLNGVKMRLPNATVLIAAFKAFGASTVPMDANVVYTALQTKTVDGLDVPFDIVDSNKYYEVVKYSSRTNHSWTGYSIMANMARWNGLPSELKPLFEKEFDRAGVESREQLVREDPATIAALKGHGLLYNDADINAFREAIKKAGLYTQWRERYGAEAWGLLEKSVGKLT